MPLVSTQFKCGIKWQFTMFGHFVKYKDLYKCVATTQHRMPRKLASEQREHFCIETQSRKCKYCNMHLSSQNREPGMQLSVHGNTVREKFPTYREHCEAV